MTRSLVALLVFAALSNAALASSSPYPSAVTGNDIGYPRCGTAPAGGGTAEAAGLCGTGSFDGGPVWLVQYSGGQTLDTDYGC